MQCSSIVLCCIHERHSDHTMNLIEYFFASLWSFTVRLAGFVLLLSIILHALRSLFGGSRR